MIRLLINARNWLWVQGVLSAYYGVPVAIAGLPRGFDERWRAARSFERSVKRAMRGRA